MAQLDSTVGSLELSLNARYEEFSTTMIDKMNVYRFTDNSKTDSSVFLDVTKVLADSTAEYRNKVLMQARAGAFNAISDVQMFESMISGDKEYINRHYIELMRKFTLSVYRGSFWLNSAKGRSGYAVGGIGGFLRALLRHWHDL